MKLTVFFLYFLPVVPSEFEVVVRIIAAVDGVHDGGRPDVRREETKEKS